MKLRILDPKAVCVSYERGDVIDVFSACGEAEWGDKRGYEYNKEWVEAGWIEVVDDSPIPAIEYTTPDNFKASVKFIKDSMCKRLGGDCAEDSRISGCDTTCAFGDGEESDERVLQLLLDIVQGKDDA